MGASPEGRVRSLTQSAREFVAARIELLRRNQVGALVLNSIAGVILAYLLSFDHPVELVLGWLAAIALGAALRAGLLWRTDSRLSPRLWEICYALAGMVHGIAWGSVFVLFGHQTGFLLVFMHLLAGAYAFVAIATLGVSLPAYLAFVCPVVTGQLGWLLHSFSGEAFPVAALGGCYIVVLTIGLTVFRRALLGGMQEHEASLRLLSEQEALFNNSLVGLALTRRRIFVRVNDAFARTYGFRRDEMEGRVSDMIFPDRETWLKSVHDAENALRVGGEVVYEREYVLPDGQKRWLLAQGNLIDRARPGVGAIWVVADITPRKKAELQLAAREQAYRSLAETYHSLMETTPAMIWTTDVEGRYTFASERGTRAIFGVAAAEVQGKFFSDFMRPDDLERDIEAFRSVMRGSTVHDHASEGFLADGRRIAVSVSGAPLHDADGRVIGACGTNVDITDRQQRAAELEQARDLLRNAVESIPDGFALFDASDRLVLANRRYVQLYTNAKSFSEISGATFEDLVRSSLRKGEPIPADFRGDTDAWVRLRVHNHQRADGTPFTYRVGGGGIIRVTEKRTPDGGIVGVRTDITELENARALLVSAIDSMGDGFAVFSPDERLLICNRPYAALADPQRAPHELIGMTVEAVMRLRITHGAPLPPEFLGDTDAWVRERLLQHRAADGSPQLYQTGDGRWIQTIKRRTPDGGVVGVYSDITRMKRTEEAVRRLAQHDALTGLPNRRLLHDRLDQALARARRASEMVALLLIDLDGFKPINDEHGHRTGDEVLRVVATRLRECVRAADTVARYGGDEFVVVIDGLADSADAGAVADKIIEALARPIQPIWATMRRGRDFRIGCSIGISLFPGDGTDPDVLIRLADGAMYRAKQAGRGQKVYHAAPPDVHAPAT